MSFVDLSWRPEGATHYLVNRGKAEWRRKTCNSWFYFDSMWLPLGAHARENLYTALPPDLHAGGAQMTENPTKWDGSGLPPVGIECEWHCDNQSGWRVVTVLAYSGSDAWIQPKGGYSMIVGNPINFRPIRTPEQIERDEAIAAMMKDSRCDTPWDEFGRLYDAGWRK